MVIGKGVLRESELSPIQNGRLGELSVSGLPEGRSPSKSKGETVSLDKGLSQWQGTEDTCQRSLF